MCWLRPTGENIAYLRRELRQPCYGEYHVCFTNIARDTYLQELGEADEKELIKQAGFCGHLWPHLGLPPDPSLCHPTGPGDVR